MILSSRRHVRHALAACVLATLGAGSAAAQPRPGAGLKAAQAEQLFNDGKRLMGEGRIADACTAFEGSYDKDPVVSTLLNLADCREKNHQIASAWNHFLAAERQTRTDPAQAALNQTARTRAAALEPRLSFLIVNVPDDSRVDGLTVSRNGEDVDPAEWNRKSPVDGGTYTIEGKAPAHEPWSAKVTVGAERDIQAVNVPQFKALPDPPPGEELVGATAPSRWTGKRKASLALVGVGVAAGAGALFLELSARSTYDDSTLEVDDAKQKDLYDQANSKRLYAQIAGGVAIAAVGTAAVLWFTGKPVTREQATALRPIVGRDKVGLAFAGHF